MGPVQERRVKINLTDPRVHNSIEYERQHPDTQAKLDMSAFGYVPLLQLKKGDNSLEETERWIRRSLGDGQHLDNKIILGFFNRIGETDPKLGLELVKYNQGSEVFNFEVFNALPRDLLIELVEVHQAVWQETVDNFNPNIFKSQLLDYLLSPIAKTLISLSEEEIRKRVSDVTIIPMDPMNIHANLVGDEHVGRYHKWSDQFFFLLNADNQVDEKVMHTGLHEAIHMLSGSTYAVNDSGNVRYMRHGLSFSFSARNGRFDWFNEAVTEIITSKLSGQDIQAYHMECSIVYSLIDQSNGVLSLPDFTNAFFENYYLFNDAGEKIPYQERASSWKILYSKINSVFGPKFLLNIDQHIKRQKEIQANEIPTLMAYWQRQPR
jgi:hypothetical protein